MMKRILAVAMIAAAAVLGTPVAQADPGWGHDGCDCGGYYGGGGYPYYGGGGGYYGWYPGKWLSGCVSGPYGHVQVCW